MIDSKKSGFERFDEYLEKGQKIVADEVSKKGAYKRPYGSELDFKKACLEKIISTINDKTFSGDNLAEQYKNASSSVDAFGMGYSIHWVIDLINIFQRKKSLSSLIEEGFSKEWLDNLNKEYEVTRGFNYPSSIFFSALINRVIKENDWVYLSFKHDKSIADPWFHDYFNFSTVGLFLPRGTIQISSDYAGEYLGNMMTGGKIIVKGDSKSYVGDRMKGGKILIEGDLIDIEVPTHKRGCGYEMEGGLIEVKGNANLETSGYNGGLGTKMRGGEIIVNKDVRDVGYEMNGGKITVKGNAKASGPEHGIGWNMKNGEIIVEGNVNVDVGCGIIADGMSGGKITIKGDCEGGGIGNSMRAGEIIVHGEVFPLEYPINIGREMSGGKIIIQKSVHSECIIGYDLSHGSIEIKGDAIDSDIGSQMKSGSITIRGSSSAKLGDYMRGGTINIWGGMASRRNLGFDEKPTRYGGEIYHQGRPVKFSLLSKLARWTNKKGW